MRLARPLSKVVYPHLDMRALDRALAQAAGKARRAVVVTDGIFSMRGVHAPVDEIMEIARRHDRNFPENVVVVLDDSHGVGAIGTTGRGTEEYTGAPPVDLLVATLGKALGVNGGYVATSSALVRYLRESAPFYIYSNPITPGRGEGRAEGAGDSRQRGGTAAAGAPARAHPALRGWPGAARDRSAEGGAPGGSADDPRDRAHA